MERVKTFISTAAPEYRKLWIDSQDKIDEAITPEVVSETQIDLALYKIKQERVLRNKHEAKKLIDEKVEDIKSTNEFICRYNRVIEAVSEDGRADLARYIVQRRIIIDLLKKSLQLQSDGKYCYEEVIHNMIMPKHRTSDEIADEEHNLWLIDEKLAYHYFLASDKPFSELQSIACNSEDKADLLMLNSPAAFSEGEFPYGSITIVEFKRPDRNNYARNESPIDQVLNYIEQIRNGIAYDKNGQALGTNERTPFYCYIICDLKPAIRNALLKKDFTVTPDGEGYFGFHKQFNAYIEVIPYRKLVSDAEKRNRALFEHLHL